MFDPDAEAAPLPALSRIMQRVMEVAGKHGLRINHFGIHPNLEPDGPHYAHVIHTLDDDWKPETEQEADPEFERVIREAEEAERQAAQEEARAKLTDLRDSLRDPSRGIGLDD